MALLAYQHGPLLRLDREDTANVLLTAKLPEKLLNCTTTNDTPDFEHFNNLLLTCPLH